MKSAMTLLALLVLAGIAMLVTGVYLLLGAGWCLISGAVVLFIAAGYVASGLRGISNG